MKEIRIGMVNYINTAPIYEEWKRRDFPAHWRVIEEPPSTLNHLLAEDRLELGMVSSLEYAARPHRYRILRDLSISATGPVGSVFLFSRVPVEELDSRLVLLTGQSETSAALVRIVLEEFHGVAPRYRVGDILDPGSYREDVAAVLAIGDDALRLRGEKKYPVQLDLADAWNTRTGLPFVFAVFAVREDFADANPDELARIHAALLECRERGAERLAEISREVAPRIPMDPDACYRYLQQIEHRLEPAHIRALETFFAHLVRRGEAPTEALPLKFFPGEPDGPAVRSQ